MNGSEDFLDGLALVDERHGAASKIVEGGFRVDAHHCVNGGKDVIWLEGTRNRVLGLGVGGTDDLAGLQPAAGEDFWYVAFPVDEDMAALGKSLPQLCEENPEKARNELVRYLLALTDQAIEWYFERPMALLQFGPVLRKVASMGVETTRKASRSLINTLVPKLNAEQLKASAEFQASQLIALPARSH